MASSSANIDNDDEPDDAPSGATNTRQVRLEVSSQVLAVCGEWMCVAGKRVHLVRLADRAEFPLPIACTSVGFDAAGTRLLVGADDKQVLLYDTLPPGDTPPRKWTAGKKVGCVAFSPDGLFALWSDLFGECYSVALSEADATPQLVLGHLSPVSHLIFSSNGSALLTADREGHIRSSHWPHAFVIECYYLWHSTPLSLVLPLKSCPLVLSATSEGKEICVWKAHSGALLDRVAASTCINPPKMELESVFDNPQCSLTLSIACACEIVSQSLVAFAYPTGIAFCKIEYDSDASTAKLLEKEGPRRINNFDSNWGDLAAMAHSAESRVLCALTKGKIPDAFTGTSSTEILLFPELDFTYHPAGFGFDEAAAKVVRLLEEPSQNPQAAGEEAMAIS